MEHFFANNRTLSKLRKGPLEKYLRDFAENLGAEGFNGHWICHQIRLAADFSQWLVLNGVKVQEIRHMHAKKYLKYRKRKGHARVGDLAIVKRILILLQSKGLVIEDVLPEPSPVDQLVNDFGAYLLIERALAPTTVKKYKYFARRFLRECFGDGSVDLSCPSGT